MNELNLHALPRESQLEQELPLFVGSGIQDLIQKQLLRPLEDLMSRPSKNLRGDMVEFGYRLAADDIQPITQSHRQLIAELAMAVETFHAASLAVDDIQDDSPTRRGRPSLHLTYGVNVALNAGNWLYFWPFERIERLDLPLNITAALQSACRKTLLRAHYGQALDVGVRIDQLPQSRIRDVSLAAMELKSGALMSLPLELGSILAGLGKDRTTALQKFGHQFGVALQMFNDIGNFKGNTEPDKKMEDLRHRRPSWLWASMASCLGENDFLHFLELVELLPNAEPLTNWMTQNGHLELAKKMSADFMEESFEELENQFPSANARTKIIPQIKEIGAKIARSYD